MTNYWEHSLQDSFEYEGLWWRPDEPDDRVPGILSYDSNEGTMLKLLGTFRGIPFFTTEAARLQTINGLTVDGVECTLSDVLEAGGQLARGMSTQSYIANTLLLGKAVADLGSVRFMECHLSLEHLEKWITPRVFEVDPVFENGRFTQHTTKVVSRREFEETIDAIGAVLSMSNVLSVENNHPSQVVQRSEVLLRIQPDEPQSYDTFSGWVVELSRLFSILVGDYCSPRSIGLSIETSDETDASQPQIPASVFYRRSLDGSGERLSRHEMPVEFSTFADHVNRIFDSWFKFEEKAKSVSDLFFTSVYSDDTHQVNRFLSLVHALESYHRNRHGGIYVEPERYADYEAKIVGAFPSDLPQDLRQALKSRIKYGNQYSLRKRVGLLLTKLDDDLRVLITDSPDQFTNEIVDTRNYYVHYDDEDSGEVLEPLEMLLANQQLELFVRVLLMSELGFSDDEIHTMLKDKLKLLPTIRIPRERETSKAD